jgi:hypothetical protein
MFLMTTDLTCASPPDLIAAAIDVARAPRRFPIGKTTLQARKGTPAVMVSRRLRKNGPDQFVERVVFAIFVIGVGDAVNGFQMFDDLFDDPPASGEFGGRKIAAFIPLLRFSLAHSPVESR